MFRPLVVLVVAVCLQGGAKGADERAWEIRGEVVSVKAGPPEVVQLRLSDGRVVELPLESFSEKSRAAVAGATPRPAAPSSQSGGGPVAPAEGLPDTFAADLRNCRTAAEIADACRIFLAIEGQPEAARKAAKAQYDEIAERAARGEVRLEGEWVAADKAVAASRAADGHYQQAIEMLKLGNMKVAEESLRQASRADPRGVKAEMLTAFMSLVGAKPSIEAAQRAFAEAAARDPASGPAWNNLGVCEVQARRYPQAVAAFEAAAAHVSDPQVVLENVGFVIRMADDRRNKITPKQLKDFTDLYGRLIASVGPRQQQPAPALTYLTLFDAPVSAAGGWDLGFVVAAPAWQPSERVGVGYAVAEGYVLVPGAIVEQADLVMVRPAAPGSPESPGTVVGTTADRSLALVQCDGLQAPALPIADVAAKRSAAVRLPRPVSPQGQPAGEAIAGKVVISSSGKAEAARFVYEAAEVPRLAGLPVVDEKGRLIGLNARKPRLRIASEKLGLAMPVEAIWPMLKKHIPSLEPATAETADDAAGVEARLAASAVTVTGRSTVNPATR